MLTERKELIEVAINSLKLAIRFLKLVPLRLLATMAWRAGVSNVISIWKFQRRLKRGVVFPPFLFISITSRCNLRCRGCWVKVDASPPGDLSPATIKKTIDAAKRMGNKFFGILGGEPLCHPNIREILSNHPDCYFQVFTNGTTLTPPVARWMRRLGNITPLISIEGNQDESDRRRGGKRVLDRSRQAVAACVDAGLPTGVATSLCRSNIDHMLTESFLDEMIDLGVLYVWYYIYRPSGHDSCPDEALTKEQIRRARQFIVDMRVSKPVMVVDSYWDHDGRALCPAAVGISHHISPWGDVEPCPPLQFAAENITDGDPVKLITESNFLSSFRKMAAGKTRGCILLDDPEALCEFIEGCGAEASSGRDGLEEIRAMEKLPCHDLGDEAIPDRNPLYRIAKKRWFFGFGAYG